MSMKCLNNSVILFLAVSIATLWAFFLPSVQHSVYFYRENIITDGIADAENLAAVTEDSGKRER